MPTGIVDILLAVVSRAGLALGVAFGPHGFAGYDLTHLLARQSTPT